MIQPHGGVVIVPVITLSEDLKMSKVTRTPSLNKLDCIKGHGRLGATKPNYRTELAMEFKTTCSCFGNHGWRANNTASKEEGDYSGR